MLEEMDGKRPSASPSHSPSTDSANVGGNDVSGDIELGAVYPAKQDWPADLREPYANPFYRVIDHLRASSIPNYHHYNYYYYGVIYTHMYIMFYSDIFTRPYHC
jgi:hypothetical protein